MSLTSYRAAPPRDKPLRLVTKAETAGSTPEGAASVQRLPEKVTLGLEGREVAGGMYQRPSALERAASPIFMDFVTAKSAKSQVSSPNLTERRTASDVLAGGPSAIADVRESPDVRAIQQHRAVGIGFIAGARLRNPPADKANPLPDFPQKPSLPPKTHRGGRQTWTWKVSILSSWVAALAVAP